MVNMQNAQPQASPPLPRNRLGDFQCTRPPTFSHSVELMDADDWLRTVERKLQVVQCNNREKVLLASHQLTGPAADWWDAYVEAHEEPDTINWNEFKMAFRSHHIPQGVIKLKKEFQDLKQGAMTATLQVTWTPTRRSKSVSSMDWTMDLHMLWKPETSRIFRSR
jgi:hypothetical protein